MLGHFPIQSPSEPGTSTLNSDRHGGEYASGLREPSLQTPEEIPQDNGAVRVILRYTLQGKHRVPVHRFIEARNILEPAVRRIANSYSYPSLNTFDLLLYLGLGFRLC